MKLAFSKIAFVFGIGIFAFSASAQTKRPVAVTPFRSITIATEPGAIVWVDGVRYGAANEAGKFEIKTISAGAHSLRVRSDGFKEKLLPLIAAQNGEIHITLVTTTDKADLAFQEAERQTSADREKAIAAYRNALTSRPNFPEARLGLARMLYETSDLDQALVAVAAARKLRPLYAEASTVEGRIHEKNGDEEKAVAAFKRAITEGRGFQPEAYTGLGLLYQEKAEGFGAGDFEGETANYAEASKYLKLALKQLSGAPDATVIYQILGRIYERQKRFTEAIALYEEFLRLFPDSPDATAVESFIVQIKKDMASQD